MIGSRNQGYLLIAIGKQYIDECAVLATTIRKCGDNRPISIIINSDDRYYAESKQLFDKFINFEPFGSIWNDCRTGFEKYCLYPRIHFDDYLVYDETIIVDSDVLCQFSTENLWKYLSNQSNSVVMLGRKNDPKWHWGYIQRVSDAFGENVPHTHGGFFYIRKKPEDIGKFFNMSKLFFWAYDDYNCLRAFRGGKVDEIIFALTHAFFKLKPLEFDEFPVMTFNISHDINLPTKLQTEGNQNIEMNEPCPFIHFFDKLGGKNHSAAFEKILKYGD